MRYRLSSIFVLTAIISITVFGQAPLRITERGTSTARKVGVHDGNLVKTVFTNYGVIAQPGAQGPRGTWKGENNGYVGDVSPLIGVRLPIKDYNNDGTPDTIHSVVITAVERPGGGKYAPGGKFWGFEPIPGFMNPAVSDIGKGVAMTHQPDTWPLQWPDQPTWTYTEKPIIINGEDKTPKVDWNGYFGRGRGKTATQESYFWMDDNNDEQYYRTYGYLSDLNDTSRRGNGLQVAVRGLQWGGDPIAQNVLFWIYKIKNDGTNIYDQSVFGCLVGTYVGIDGTEWDDDASFFDVRESITYTWDFDHYIRPSANPRWVPNPTAVGYIGYAFLESPGNGFDGFDNDRDNLNHLTLSPKFQESDFSERTLKTGDKYVLITRTSSGYTREVKTVGSGIDTVYSLGRQFIIVPGSTKVNEGNIDYQGNVNPNALDGLDNDLDGLIDENYTVNYRQYKKSPTGTVLIDTLNTSQYFDYIGGIGITETMIDERRDDGIDNDGDWDRRFDDVGTDGKAGTHDFGEGDGIPTAGEPNFDQTDVHESDQLGLTSFQYFVPAGDIKMSDNEDMWRRFKPGYYDVPKSIVNNVAIKGEDGDFVYGSGYFPLLPGRSESFSLALLFGDDLRDILKTKRVVQMIYNANYTFPGPPETPTLTAVPGDKKVTLYWDHAAEESVDQVTREKDFEGYKIYKSTKYDFKDVFTITDAEGKAIGYKPIAQFDLKNGILGYYPLGGNLRDLYKGYAPYLGEDNGIQNTFVDNDVVNGITYYYAVTSYDHGKNDSVTFPKENTFSVTRNTIGKFFTTQNTAIVTPNAPSAGYVPAPSGEKLTRVKGLSTSTPTFEVLDPYKLKNNTYVVYFKDTVYTEVYQVHDTVKQGPIGYSYNVYDSTARSWIFSDYKKMTTGNGEVFDGIRLSFDTTYQNPDKIGLNGSGDWKLKTPISDTIGKLLVSALNTINYSIDNQGNPVVLKTTKMAHDYAFVFSDVYADSSFTLDTLDNLFGTQFPKSSRINFKIWDITDPANKKRLKFTLFEPDYGDLVKPDTLSADDIIFLSDESGRALTWTLQFSLQNAYVPKGGDTLFLHFFKPMSTSDRFIFKTSKPTYNSSLADSLLKNIRAVPNPYVVTNLYEPEPAAQLRGRGERVIKFINLPPKAKIHIYASNGSHIRSLEHDGSLLNGTVKWDLRTREGLEVAYGVYFYVVEVEGLSEKRTGKLAIIK